MDARLKSKYRWPLFAMAALLFVAAVQTIVTRIWHLPRPFECQETIVSQVDSENGQHAALVMSTNCGAQDPFTTDVILRAVNREQPHSSASTQVGVLAARTQIRVNLLWVSNEALMVEYEDRKVFARREEPWNGVHFIYRRLE